MAGSAIAVPAVLAGPILQRLTPTRATLLLATSNALKFNQLSAEVWDPLPDGQPGYLPAPDPAAGLAGGLRTPYNVESRAIGKELHLHRITLDAERGGWPGNRALAYRVAPTGTDWLPPPGGSQVLPGDPDAIRARGAPRTAFPHAWFALDPLGLRWSVLSLHAKAPPLWVEAETYLARLARGSRPRNPGAPNPRGANVGAGRPTTALAFAVDAIPSDAAAVTLLAQRIARDIETNLATALCGYLLALSPDLWDVVAALQTVAGSAAPPARAASTVTRDRAKALARIAAHVPLYGIPAWVFSQPGVSANERTAAIQAFALCFGWGNAGQDPTPPNVGDFTGGTQYLTGAPPSLSVSFFVPDWFPHPLESAAAPGARVFPFFAAATPSPVLPLAPPAGYTPPKLGAYDNLFVLSADTTGYAASPRDQVEDGDKPRQRDPHAFTTAAAHRLYQMAIAPSATPGAPAAGARTGKAITWNAAQLKYADGAPAPILAAAPTFSVLMSETTGTKMGYRLALFTDAAHGISLLLQRTGHRVLPKVLPKGTSDLYIGNRFRIAPEDDDRKLGGIDVYIDGVKRATTDPDGLVRGLLATLTDGEHTIAIGGALTQSEPPGPATPTAAQTGARLWRQRTFKVLVRDHQIVQVDDEPVLSPGVRILIDPVWMKLVSGVRTGGPGPNRTRPVTLFIVHRPDQGNARATATKWQKTERQRIIDKDDLPAGANTAAHYLLARDGTLIKMEADNKVVNHAFPGHWGEQTTGTPPKSVDTQDMAVGVEVSKSHEDPNPYTDAQYEHLLWLLGEYVTKAGLHPLDIVGHSDVKDTGKDDPGLTFEWSRLEAEGFGIRPPNMLNWPVAEKVRLTPLPEFPLDWSNPRAQQIRQPTTDWQAQVAVEVSLDFPTLFAAELAAPHPQQAVDAKVNDLIKSIGYHQSLRLTVPKVQVALYSFRSHFFSGPRRMLFRLDRAAGATDRLIDEEGKILVDDDLRKITAIWAKRVADFVASARLAPTRPKVQKLPPAPR